MLQWPMSKFERKFSENNSFCVKGQIEDPINYAHKRIDLIESLILHNTQSVMPPLHEK